MLQIRLSKQPVESAVPTKPSPAETVTVACPDHLVLADLPVAKGIGVATAATASNTLGRRSRRLLGDRVHFCVRCDYPIAIYGRLSPCDHAFCLDCARSDSICYLCDEGIQKIQSIKMMEGIFICAAPHCLKSFLKMEDLTAHIHESHSELLQSNTFGEDGAEHDLHSVKSAAMDSGLRFAPRPLISPTPEGDDKSRRLLPLQRPMMPSKQPLYGQMQTFHFESHGAAGFERHPSQNHFPVQQESAQGMPENSDYPPPSFVMPVIPSSMGTPQYGMPPFHHEGGQPMYVGHYEMAHMSRTDATADPSGFIHGDYGRGVSSVAMVGHPHGPPLTRAPAAQDHRDGRGVLAPQPFHHPLPPPQLSHTQPPRQRSFSNDRSREGQSFGWQRDGFVSGQD